MHVGGMFFNCMLGARFKWLAHTPPQMGLRAIEWLDQLASYPIGSRGIPPGGGQNC